MSLRPNSHRAKAFRQMQDGNEVSLAAGVALRPGTAIFGEVKCCDCGLVHTHRYRLTKRGTLKMTSWRKK